ncbi:hypothetical protein [Vulcanisaeta distributa]|uniref:Uncharacterized protein n=1 Tax=Vulcanisaeta distributa (strain DSM 14429 / JCM 11212 / NBRC 100878 / IC-017) TaxID=572478 RepID=E1QSC7_VULDI|nr:hypothetical protein [Vulcanisaeta distributa]ADN49520.1 hypothetical protein Vdis_0107 [Vulcanisaeta distributa DSM 14429]
MFRGFGRAVLIISLFLIVYYLIYSLSLIYLKPYIHYYLSVASTHTRVFNFAVLIIFLTSPFNAYEAVIIHVDPTTYFLMSVLLPTTLMLVFLTLYNHVVNRLGVRPVIPITGFTVFTIAASLTDSWVVSLGRWLVLGAPSIGTSVYSIFQLTATMYIVVTLIIQVIKITRSVGFRHEIKSRLITIYALITIIIILVITAVYYVLMKYAPIANTNHAVGLIIATLLIYAYHKFHH